MASTSSPGLGPNGVSIPPNSACSYARAVPGKSPRFPSAMTSSPCVAGVPDRRLEREPAGEAEPLEARELRLDRHARRPGRVDQRQAVAEHGGGRVEARLPAASAAVERRRPLDVLQGHDEPSARLGEPLDRIRPQLRRGGIDAQDDLGFPPCDRGGEAISERRGR